MSDDLLNPRYEKKPRTYYKATASTGVIAIRSSHRDMYSYACLNINDNSLGGFTYWATFSSKQHLAERTCKWSNKHYNESKDLYFEVVELEKITRQEFGRLSRLRNKQVALRREESRLEREAKFEQLQQQQETELSNV